LPDFPSTQIKAGLRERIWAKLILNMASWPSTVLALSPRILQDFEAQRPMEVDAL
jgi:ketopantoate reductase